MLQKILAPLDGSDLAEQALPYAEALAEKFHGELILLWVTHSPMVATEFGDIAVYDAAVTGLEAEAKRYLSNLQEQYLQRQIPVRTLTLTSPSVAEAIVDVAIKESVDVIVKTTHGRSGLSRMLLGSVATKVLQQAPCPVFLVRVQQEKRASTA